MDGLAVFYILLGLSCVILALAVAKAIPQILEMIERLVLSTQPPERRRRPPEPPPGTPPWG